MLEIVITVGLYIGAVVILVKGAIAFATTAMTTLSLSRKSLWSIAINLLSLSKAT